MNAEDLFRTLEPVERRPHGTLITLAFCAVVAMLSLWFLSGHSLRLLEAAAMLAALVGVIAASVYTTRNPEWVVLAILLTFAVTDMSLLDDSVRVFVHYGSLAIFCLPLVPTALKSGLLKRGGYKLYVCYLLWAGITVIYSVAPLYSAARLLEATMVMLALVAMVSQIEDMDGVYRVIGHIFTGGAIVFAISCLSYLLLPASITWTNPELSISPAMLEEMRKIGTSVSGIERFQSVFNGPNEIGAFMVTTVGAGLVLWRRVRGAKRLYVAVVLAIALVFAVMSDSRTPMAGIAVGGIIYILWRYRLKGLLFVGALAAVSAALLVIFGPQMNVYLDRGDVTTLTGRTEMWSFVVSSIWKRPLFGYGYEVGGAIFNSPYFPLWYGPWDEGVHVSVHNGYLSHAEGLGIPAAIFWLYIMLMPWVYLMRRKSDGWQLKSVGLLMLLPFLLHNLAEVMADDALGPVGFPLGVIWVIAERYRQVMIDRTHAEEVKAAASLPPPIAVLAARNARG